MSKASIRPLPEGLIIGLVTLLAIGVNINWTYHRALEALQGEVKEGLLRTVTATARMMDGRLADQHKMFHPVARAGECNDKAQWKRLQADKDFADWRTTTTATPMYAEWKLRMEEVRKATAHVRYLYTCVLINGHVYFAFNEAPQSDMFNNITGVTPPDGLVDPAPNLLWPYPDAGKSQIRALTDAVACVDDVPYTDTWGTYYSGYAPFYDSDGKIVGTIGMDLETTGFNQRMAPIIIASKRAAVTGFCVAILSGVVVWFVRRLCSQLWRRAGDGDGGGRADTAVLQNAKSAYAAGLLSTLYSSADPGAQLGDLQRVIDSGRPVDPGENANFRSAAVVQLAREQSQLFGTEIEVTLAPELPELLYAPSQRVSDALVDCLEGLPGPELQVRVSMEDERIQWLTLVVRFSQPFHEGNTGNEGEIDCLAENRVALASAQAHARALRGDMVAMRTASGVQVTLRLPVRKSQQLETEV